MKDSSGFDNDTVWALKTFHEVLVDLWARSSTRNLTRVLVSSTISLTGQEGVGAQELSEKLGIPLATVSHAVAGLLKDGLLIPVEHRSDARQRPIRYSFEAREETRAWAETIAKIWVRSAIEAFGGVEPAIERFRSVAERGQVSPPEA